MATAQHLFARTLAPSFPYSAHAAEHRPHAAMAGAGSAGDKTGGHSASWRSQHWGRGMAQPDLGAGGPSRGDVPQELSRGGERGAASRALEPRVQAPPPSTSSCSSSHLLTRPCGPGPWRAAGPGAPSASPCLQQSLQQCPHVLLVGWGGVLGTELPTGQKSPCGPEGDGPTLGTLGSGALHTCTGARPAAPLGSFSQKPVWGELGQAPPGTLCGALPCFTGNEHWPGSAGLPDPTPSGPCSVAAALGGAHTRGCELPLVRPVTWAHVGHVGT